jgi:putative peptidoglycan lipid II flippase
MNPTLGALAALQLIGLFALHVLTVSLVGVGVEMDAYIAAQAVPMFLSSVVTVSLQSVWQPRLAVSAHDHSTFTAVQGSAVGQCLVLLVGIGVVVWLFKSCWIGVLFPGLSSEGAALVAGLTLPALLATMLNGQSAILTVGLRANGAFALSEQIAIAGTALALVLIWLVVPRYGVHAAAWILFVRGVFVYTVFLWRCGWPRLILFGSQYVQWPQLRPLIVGSVLYKTGPIVDRFLTSQGGVGAMTTYSLAQMVASSCGTVLDRMLSVPILPQIARSAAAHDYCSMQASLRSAVFKAALVSLALALCWSLLSEVIDPLLTYCFGVDSVTARRIWTAALYLVPIVFAGTVGSVFVAVFYALADTRTPVLVGAFAYVCGVLFKSLGFGAAGISGIAAGTSAYYLLNIVILGFLLRLKLIQLGSEGLCQKHADAAAARRGKRGE